MAWGTRQDRLKRLFGEQNALCFSVFAITTESNSSNLSAPIAKEFDCLELENKVSLKKGEHFDFPRLSLGDFSHHGGFLWHAPNGDRIVERMTLSRLYSIAQYTMQDTHPEWGDAALDMHFIKSLFMPQLLERYPDYDQYLEEDDYFIDWDNWSLKFGYIVQPYSPDICHPGKLGKVFPINVPDGSQVIPPIDTLETQQSLRASELRDKSFTLR